MPVSVQKRGDEWCAVEKYGGKTTVDRCYPTEAAAKKYVQGKNMGMKRSKDKKSRSRSK